MSGPLLKSSLPKHEQICLLYTLRASSMRKHGGEISFPGGNSDPGESPTQTALREMEEELGIARDKVDVWGQMAPISDKSGAQSFFFLRR